MTKVPTPEEQLKSIDGKLQQKKASTRGKYIRKKKLQKDRLIPSVDKFTIDLVEEKNNLKPMPKTLYHLWPKITLKQKSGCFYPVCFTAYKILHAMDRLYFSKELIAALEETGLKIEVQDA